MNRNASLRFLKRSLILLDTSVSNLKILFSSVKFPKFSDQLFANSLFFIARVAND